MNAYEIVIVWYIQYNMQGNLYGNLNADHDDQQNNFARSNAILSDQCTVI